jgi:hypothetical protein
MQIKPQGGTTSHLLGQLWFRKQLNNKCHPGVEKSERACITSKKVGVTTGESSRMVSQTVNRGTTIWPQNSSSYSKESKAGTTGDICTPVFKAALFATAKRWKQPKCPPTDKWINKMWDSHTMEYYPASKRSKILIYNIKHGYILKTLRLPK